MTVSQAIAADGTRLTYDWRPNPGRPALVLVHSLALDRSLWGPVADILADDFQILTYDCRGHGQSDDAPGPYDPFLFADDLAVITDRAAIPPAVVAGCSMGGCVAQAFAARYGAKVTALALIDTTDWYGAAAPAQWRERAQKARGEGLASLIPFQTTRWFSPAFVEDNRAEVDRLNAVFTDNDIDSYEATCLMLGDADLRGQLKGFAKPVAVIVGEEDYATPVAMAQALADSIPGATLQVIAAGRHLTPIQCPNEIAEALRALAALSV